MGEGERGGGGWLWAETLLYSGFTTFGRAVKAFSPRERSSPCCVLFRLSTQKTRNLLYHHQVITPSTDLQGEMFPNLLDLFWIGFGFVLFIGKVKDFPRQHIIASASGSDLTMRHQCSISYMLSMRPQLLGCNMNNGIIDRIAWLLKSISCRAFQGTRSVYIETIIQPHWWW